MNIRLEGKIQVQEFLKATNNLISNKVPFLKGLQRKHKSFVIYRLWKSNCMITKQFKRVSFSSWKEFYGDPNVIGFTPDYIGFRKSKPLRLPRETWNSVNRVSFSNLDYSMISKSCIEERQVWTGSPDSNSLHLRRFFKKNKTRRSFDGLLNIIEKSNWFSVPSCTFEDPREMQYVTNFNPKAYPGHITSRLLSARNKGTTVNASLILAFKLYKMCRAVPMTNETLWDIFAREKDIKINGVDSEVTTRVVVTTEEYVAHFTSWIVNKLLAAFSTYTDSRFHIKGEYDGVKAYNLWKKVHNYDFVIDADWSMFDSTIDTVYLELACMILFAPSIHSKEDMRMMYFVMNSIIYKNIIVPPGVVVKVNRGNPSGHPCVTVINCLVNMIRWAVIGYEIYGDDYANNMDIEVYGDDAVVMFKSHPNLMDIDDICYNEGYESEPLVQNLFPADRFGVDIDDSPDFLKRRISPKGVSWNKSKIVNKILYPSKERDVDEQINLMLDFITTGPCDEGFNNWLKEVISDMIKVNTVSSVTIERFNNIFNNIEKYINKFSFQTERVDEGFLYEKNLTQNGFSEYKGGYSEVFESIDPRLLQSILIHVFPMTLANRYIRKDSYINSLFDIREDMYYNFIYPKEWLSNHLTKGFNSFISKENL